MHCAITKDLSARFMFIESKQNDLIWEERYCNVWVVLCTTLQHMHKRSGGGHSSCISWRVRGVGGWSWALPTTEDKLVLLCSFFFHFLIWEWCYCEVWSVYMHTTQLDLNMTWNYETWEFGTLVCVYTVVCSAYLVQIIIITCGTVNANTDHLKKDLRPCHCFAQ